jgi:hypothetical protein
MRPSDNCHPEYGSGSLWYVTYLNYEILKQVQNDTLHIRGVVGQPLINTISSIRISWLYVNS